MHRFYLPPDRCSGAGRGSLIRLDPDESRHASRVLRLAPGAALRCLNGCGSVIDGTVESVSASELVVRVLNRREEPRPGFQLTLVQSVLKGKAMDAVIQKATELGVDRILPVLSAHSVPDFDTKAAGIKAERWHDIAVESLKQCGNPWLPGIEPPLPFPEALDRMKHRGQSDWMCVGVLDSAAPLPAEALAAAKPAPCQIAAWIGPEGDFSIGELELLTAAGAHGISLGPTVLRADTAAVALLAILRAERLRATHM